MDGTVFICRRSWHFSFVSNLKYFCLLCTLTWRVNNYVSRQGKGTNRRIESIKREAPSENFINQLTVRILTSYSFEITFSAILLG